tara:strand:+ start:6055 stop:6483 length:429 start_codon:yes stop_codon:yes gene_type:complete
LPWEVIASCVGASFAKHNEKEGAIFGGAAPYVVAFGICWGFNHFGYKAEFEPKLIDPVTVQMERVGEDGNKVLEDRPALGIETENGDRSYWILRGEGEEGTDYRPLEEFRDKTLEQIGEEGMKRRAEFSGKDMVGLELRWPE